MGSLNIDFSFKGALTMSAKETKEFYFSVELLEYLMKIGCHLEHKLYFHV